MVKKPKKFTVIGWREWVALPELGVPEIKAKIDTGARTSSLHADELEIYTESGKEIARFIIHPLQKSKKPAIEVTSQIVEYRHVKSSNGQIEERPVILTDLELLDQRWPIELTLTNRDEMGFRLLLGRRCFRRRFLIDARRSFYGKKDRLDIYINPKEATS